ncbi:MAG: AsmA-like C-terminal region-containing protein [Vicingaceae bacterium]
MKKLKIISIIIGILIAIFVVIGIVFSTLYEDKVKAYIIEQINNSVATEIDVKNVEFSVFKQFPYASLEFKKVTAKEAIKTGKKGTLFSAQSIYLQFNIIDVLNENYVIKTVKVEDGIVNVKIDKNGNDNYHFWKKSGTSENQLSIELEKLSLKGVTFYLLNEYKNVDMSIEAVGLSLSGNFSQDEFTMETQANLMIHQINEHEKSIIKNKSVVINTSLAVNQTTKIYQINQGEIDVEKLKFNLTGNIVNKDVGVNLNLQSEGKNIAIKDLFSLLPEKQRESLSAYKTDGNITYNSTIIGEYSIKKTPAFNANFQLKQGTFTEKSSNQSFTNIFMNGTFTNGSGSSANTSQLKIDSVKANFGAGKISGNCLISNFNNPHIKFNSKANVDLKTAKDFFKLDTLETAEGNLEINLQYKGKINELNNIKASELRKLNARGNARLTNSTLKLENNPNTVKNINGSFKFNNNDVDIDSLNFNINNSNFKLDGKFKNLLAFLFVENEFLAVKTNCHTNKLVVDDLLTNSTNNTSEYTLNLPKNVILNFKATIDTFQFRKFRATNFKGKIYLEDKVLTATDVSFNSMKGKVNGNLAIDDSKGNEILITSKVNTHKIDMNELFYQFENFGQKAISAKNLKGKISSSVEFASVFDKHLKVKKDKIYVLADIDIKNGELINYKPVLALSKYIEVEELEHIKFNSLKTQIEIKNETVHIPKTEIKSNALDLTFYGTHTFNNKIDYHFKVLMSAVLWGKAKNKKQENSEFGRIEDDGLGKTSLFLHLTGTLDNYSIKYDTKGLKESFKEDIKKEKSNLKNILNKEFGWFKKDSVIKNESKPKDNGLEIEWEEETESKDSKTPVKKNTSKKKKEAKPKKKKKGLGKFIDKLAEPEAEEFEEFDDI